MEKKKKEEEGEEKIRKAKRSAAYLRVPTTLQFHCLPAKTEGLATTGRRDGRGSTQPFEDSFHATHMQ